MVMKDSELDELWRAAGFYSTKMKDSLDVALENKRASFSNVTAKLFDEYRKLKADYEHDHEALGKLQADYQKRIAEIFELKRKYDELNEKSAEMQRQLMQRR